MTQHVFGMITRRFRFFDLGNAARVQPGEQQGRFHLGGSDRQAIAQRPCIGGTGYGERQAAALARGEYRTAGGQRVDHAAHRPAAQRGIAGHHGENVMAGQNAAEQPRGGAGIAHVEHVIRAVQPADAGTSDEPSAIRVAAHGGAEGTHGGSGAQHVLAFQQAGDAGFTDRETSEHQRAMGDRFIARHGD